MTPQRALLLLALVAPACAHADWFVTTPLARSNAQNELRADWLAEKGNRTAQRYSFGLGNGFTVAASHSPADTWGADFSYNYLPAFLDESPALSVGVLDIADETPEGRTLYAAFTFRFGNIEPHNQDTSTDLTVGIWSRNGSSAFVNVAYPITNRWLLIAEGTRDDVSAGFELRPVSQVAVRLLTRESGPFLGASLRWQF